ncbi:hypothetical protein [Luedemannella flava]
MTDTLTGLLDVFEDRFGYPPGDNLLTPAATGTDLTMLADVLTDLNLDDDLLTLYQVTDEVSLPDIGNGYFIHPPDHVVTTRRVREPGAIAGDPPTEVVVFGSDGGGTSYALTGAAGPRVVRLPSSAIVGGTYTPPQGWSRYGPAAEDLREFLTRMHDGLVRFASCGEVIDL